MGASTWNLRALPQFAGNMPMYYEGRGVIGIPRLRIDLTAIPTQMNFLPNPANADILQVWSIPQGTLIEGAMIQVVQAATETGTETIALGDGSNTYVSAQTLKVSTPPTWYGGGFTPIPYLSAGDLQITFGGTATSAKTAIFDIYLMGWICIPTGLVNITWH